MEHGHVYCVDDNEDTLRLYQIVLGQAGHDVTLLSSGADALAAISRRHPDLLILDEVMRGQEYSGMEICARVRQDPSIPYIPIIMVTGLDSKEGKIRSLEEGIDDYILKPFDHEELMAKVAVMLRIKRLYNDLLKTRQSLLTAEKLAAVGQLAAAMAHEIRNPLSIIGASVQFLKSKLSEQPEVQGMMDTIVRKISEIDGTIRELLAAARPLKLKQEPVDLNACVREVVGFIKEKCLAQGVELALELADPLPPIHGDDEHLQRVFLNICINALNSMSQGGTLRVVTQPGPRGMASVEIADTGRGIAADDLEHVFEPFFSRHSGGSGLGLYVVKMIIDELGGSVRVESQVGHGTRFIVSLPVGSEQKNLKSQSALPDTEAVRGKGVVANEVG
ncbi:MAG: ATP-binding protein [candidate division FCPU426 bacterium]